MVWISASNFAEQVLKNFAELGVEADLRTYSVEEARGLFGSLFEDADFTGVEEVLVNRTSGWAEAKEALQNTIETAVGLGVKYITAEIVSVEFDRASGRQDQCCGVKTATGEVIIADRVILCTGAFTPKLLMNSGPEWPELHASDRIIAAAVTEAISPLSTEESVKLQAMPVGINFNPPGLGTQDLYLLGHLTC